MDTPQTERESRPSRRWALLAGGYAFGCAVLTAALLSTVLDVFAEVIGLQAAFATPLLAAPALVVGAGVWWGLVERPATVTYRRGAAFGLLTALTTAALWTVRFVSVWSVEMLTTDLVPVIVAVVFGAVAVAGALVGLPFAYVRRRSRDGGDAAATANSL